MSKSVIFAVLCVSESILTLSHCSQVMSLFRVILLQCIVRISYQASHSIPVDGDYHRRRLAGDYDTDTDSHSDYSSCHDGDYDYVLTSLAQFGLLSLFWMEQTMVFPLYFISNFAFDICLLFLSLFYVFLYFPLLIDWVLLHHYTLCTHTVADTFCAEPIYGRLSGRALYDGNTRCWTLCVQ